MRERDKEQKSDFSLKSILPVKYTLVHLYRTMHASVLFYRIMHTGTIIHAGLTV